MRTLLFLVAGLLLLSAFLLLGKLFSANVADAPRMATLSFVVLWLAIADAFRVGPCRETGRRLP